MKPTLAKKLDVSKRISPLLERAKRLGLDAEGLEHLAIERGCDYYHDSTALPLRAISLEQFCNEELAIALISPALPATARSIRLAAAMVGEAHIRAQELARLAELEDCVGVLRYIARRGLLFEQNNPFWQKLLDLLPSKELAPEQMDQMPHPTRFVEMTGIDRGKVGLRTRWIRPKRPVTA